MDLQRYLAMGGYAAYVWPAYGIALLALGGLLLLRWRRMLAAERGLDAEAPRAASRDPGS